MTEAKGRGLGRRDWLTLGAAAGLGAAGLGGFARAAFAGAGIPAGLAEKAKKEGQLNLIADPRDWANYGAIFDSFSKKYGLHITVYNPDGTSAQELQAIRSLRSQSRAPDAVDVGPSFALIGAREKLFAPYKVATWDEIPGNMKDSDGYWYGDYYGVISFGVNRNVAKTVPETWADLKKPEYKGMVALNGSPLAAAAGFAAVVAAALANGGSLNDIEPGIAFFAELAKLGNYIPVTALPATLIGGQTPIAINWDFLNLADKKKGKGKAEVAVVVPEGAPPYGGFYCQAISAYAPNPSAARLWEEYLYSDEGQLLYLAGYTHPVRFESLIKAHKVPETLLKELPPAAAYKQVTFQTEAQAKKAQETLARLWPKLVKM
ncbi:MAG: ABC transporter substrate-binding protein [Acetobacteraceae bacterium]